MKLNKSKNITEKRLKIEKILMVVLFKQIISSLYKQAKAQIVTSNYLLFWHNFQVQYKDLKKYIKSKIKNHINSPRQDYGCLKRIDKFIYL